MKASNLRKSAVTVASFLKAGEEDLRLETVAGEAGLRHHISEATINRPGLALSGFFRYFAHRRIQVLGMAEQAYLSSLELAEREKRLHDFFARKVPCVVVTRNRRVFPEARRLAEEFRIPLLRSPMITKHWVNAATIIMENLAAPQTRVQGTMVEILGVGVLIEGKAGLGKSEIALGLIKRGHALVSDDITSLRLDSSGAVIASPVNVTRYHMEIRGLGIIHVPSLFGVASVREAKRLDLVVTLSAPETVEDQDRSGEIRSTREFLGVRIPQVFIPVAPGRDLSNVVETAALDQRLRRLGHDAEKELDERLVELLTGARDGSE
jgi:HPr kinase/phosphorylase